MTDWIEFHFKPHAQRYRFRWHGTNTEGYPINVEIERWQGGDLGWVDVPSYNAKDHWAMGFMCARMAEKQTELAL